MTQWQQDIDGSTGREHPKTRSHAASVEEWRPRTGAVQDGAISLPARPDGCIHGDLGHIQAIIAALFGSRPHVKKSNAQRIPAYSALRPEEDRRIATVRRASEEGRLLSGRPGALANWPASPSHITRRCALEA